MKISSFIIGFIFLLTCVTTYSQNIILPCHQPIDYQRVIEKLGCEIGIDSLGGVYRVGELFAYHDPENITKDSLPDGLVVKERCPCDTNLVLYQVLVDSTDIQEGKEGLGAATVTAEEEADLQGFASFNYITLLDLVSNEDSFTVHPKIFKHLRANLLSDRIKSPGDSMVVIAILDTGIDFLNTSIDTHSYDLWTIDQSNIECPDDNVIIGWDFVNSDNSPLDDHGHGTMVASVLVKNIPANIKYVIMPIKTHDANGFGDLYTISCAMAFAKKHGADIINASFGYQGVYNKAFADLVHEVNDNVHIVTAMGNYGEDIKHKPFYPAAFRYAPNNAAGRYRHVVPTMALGHPETRLWKCSNYITGDERKKLAAPAQHLVHLPSYFFNTPTTIRLKATSFATPYVSASLAGKLYLDPNFADSGSSLTKLSNQLINQSNSFGQITYKRMP